MLAEVCSSNPVIGKIYIEHLGTVNCFETTKLKKKRPVMAHLKQLNFLTYEGERFFFKLCLILYLSCAAVAAVAAAVAIQRAHASC